MADDSQAPSTEPQGNDTTNLVSPQGDLVSVSNDQIPAALHPVNGYRLATPQDEADYARQQKYGGVGQGLQAAAEGAVSTSTFGLVPGFGSAEDIRARQEEHPVASGLGSVAPYAIPGLGEAEELGAVGQAAKAMRKPFGIPGAILTAGQAITDASGLTGVGAKALQYAAENAIMQGSNEVSKMLLKDPSSSVPNAIANEGLAALFGGALGATAGGIGKTADMWQAKFGSKAADAIIDHTVPDIATQELQSGIDIPDSMKSALSGDQDAYNKVQVLQKSDAYAGDAMRRDVESLYDQAQNKTLETLGVNPSMIEKAPNAYNSGTALVNSLKEGIEAGQSLYGPIYDELRGQYGAMKVMPEQKEIFAGNLTKAISDAGIGALQGSAEHSAVGNLFKSLDNISNAEGVKNLNTALNNAARNPELQRLAAVAGPVIKEFESSVVQNHLSNVAAGSTTQQLARMTEAAGEAVKAGSPEAAVDAAAKLEQGIAKAPSGNATDMAKAQDMLGRRKTADAAYKNAMGIMGDLKQAIGLGRFKGTNGFLRALDDKAPEQILQRLSNKNRQDVINLLQEKFPKAAEILKNWHLNEQLNDARLTSGGLNTKKFLNKMLDGAENPPHMQSLMTGNPASLQRLNSIKGILNAIPADGNPSNSAAMLNKLWKGKIGTIAGGIFGVGGGHLTGGILGNIGEHVLNEIKPFLSYKTLEMRGSGTNIVPGQVKAMYDYATSVAQGHMLMNKAVNSIFNANHDQVMPTSKMPTDRDREKLNKYITQFQKDPTKLTNIAGDLQNNMSEHASAAGVTASSALAYLSGIKPQSALAQPLDTKVAPTPFEKGNYNRQLNIAQQPLMVLQHIKDGTLTPQDIITLQNVHPGIYPQFREQIMSQLSDPKNKLPYSTRLSMSAFLGQSLDSTMTPQGIMGAQPPPPMPAQQQPPVKNKRGTSSLSKYSKDYQTPGQAAESDRSSRD